jgi:Xaa-Pro aminopeptidase
MPPAIRSRLRNCRSSIQDNSLDGYLVTNLSEQYYLTGFAGEDGAALILKDRVYLITDGRYREEAGQSAGWAKAVVRTNSIAEVLAPLVRRHRLKRIGFSPEHLSVAAHRSYAKAIRPARLVGLPGVGRQLRIIKDATEIAALRKAIRIAEAAFSHVLRRHFRIGMTERH